MNNGADYGDIISINNGDEIVTKGFGFINDSGVITSNVMGDDLFPALSLQGYFPLAISVIFIIGLISALFPSADGALTAVTSSFCVDLLKINDRKDLSEKEKRNTRLKVHLAFTIVFFILIMIFKMINNKGIVYLIMEVAGYTYGPLLGLFAFGIFTTRNITIKYGIITVAILAPIITYVINEIVTNFTAYRIGVELIILNGLLTYLGLWLISNSKTEKI